MPSVSARYGAPTIRQPTFALDAPLAGRWHGGDAFRTHLFNALSMMFPLGEASFIDSVREFLPRLEQPSPLRAQVLAFIGQEGAHSRIHARYNARLAQLGFVNRLERWRRWRIDWRRRHLRPLDRLAVTIACEHYTAVLGAAALANPAVLAGADRELALLWRWHAVEETEHKAVAFDVYRACGGGYLRRVLWFFSATALFNFDTTVPVEAMIRRDPTRPRRRDLLRSAWRFYFGPPRMAATLLRGFLAYLRPGFHPWQHDNRAAVQAWLAANGGRIDNKGGAQ
ncbi:MAG: metal-dependent hydrolase [Betaproteobacteria bacterium]